MTDPWIERLPDRTVAMIHAFSPPMNRALLVGGVLAVVVAILMTPLVADVLPSPFQPVVTAAVGALVGVAGAFVSFPTRLRRTFEAYSWLGRTEMDRFVERTGGPVPVKPEDIERWLSATPSTSATRLARAEVLAFVGRYDDARAEIQTIEGRTPEDATELASLRQYIDWLESGTVDLEELTAAAASLPPGPTGRAIATATIALAEAPRIRRARPGVVRAARVGPDLPWARTVDRRRARYVAEVRGPVLHRRAGRVGARAPAALATLRYPSDRPRDGLPQARCPWRVPA